MKKPHERRRALSIALVIALLVGLTALLPAAAASQVDTGVAYKSDQVIRYISERPVDEESFALPEQADAPSPALATDEGVALDATPAPQPISQVTDDRPAQSETEFLVVYNPSEVAQALPQDDDGLVTAADSGEASLPADEADRVFLPETDTSDLGEISALTEVSPEQLVGDAVVRTLEAAGIGNATTEAAEPMSVDQDTAVLTVEIAKGQSLAQAMDAASQLDGVAYVQPLVYYHAQAFSDPMADQQWALDVIDAWDIFDDPTVRANIGNVTVAVLDSGVRLTHEDLQANLLPGIDFTKTIPDGNPSDALGHGTHVAGIVGAITENAVGVASPGGGAKILPVRVLDANGDGDTMTLKRGLIYAADNGADIINLSLGGSAEVANRDTYLREGIEYAQSKGCLIIAAAGNAGNKTAVDYPAKYDGVIAVGSLTPDASAQDSYYEVDKSNYEALLGNRFIHAPGQGILSTGRNSNSYYVKMDGTSMATGYVSAMAAALRAKSGGTLGGQALLSTLMANTVSAPRKYKVRFDATVYTDSANQYHMLNDDGVRGSAPETKSLVMSVNGGQHSLTANNATVAVQAQTFAGVVDTVVNGTVTLSYQPHRDGGDGELYPCGTQYTVQATLASGVASIPLDVSSYPDGQYLVLNVADNSGVFADAEPFYLHLDNAAVFTGVQTTFAIVPPAEYSSTQNTAVLPSGGVFITYAYFDQSGGTVESVQRFAINDTTLLLDGSGQYTMTAALAPGRYQFYCSLPGDYRYIPLEAMGAPVTVTATTTVPSHPLAVEIPMPEGTLTLGAAATAAQFDALSRRRIYTLDMTGWNTPAATVSLTGIQASDVTVFKDGTAIYSEFFVESGHTKVYFSNSDYPAAATGIYTMQVRAAYDYTGTVALAQAYKGRATVTVPTDSEVVPLIHESGITTALPAMTSSGTVWFYLGTPSAQIELLASRYPAGVIPYAVANKTSGTLSMRPLGHDATVLNAADLNASCLSGGEIPVTLLMTSAITEATAEAGGALVSGQAQSGLFNHYADRDDYVIALTGSPVTVSLTAATDFQLDVFNASNILVSSIYPAKSGQNYTVDATLSNGMTAGSFRFVLSSVDPSPMTSPLLRGLFVNGDYTITVTDTGAVSGTGTGASSASAPGGSAEPERQVIPMLGIDVPYTIKDNTVVPALTTELVKKLVSAVSTGAVELDFRRKSDMIRLEVTLTGPMFSAMDDRPVTFVTTFGRLTIPAGLFTDTLTLRLTRGSLIVEMLKNGRPLPWYNFEKPLLLSIPHALAAGENPDTIAMTRVESDTEKIVLPRSYYKQGALHSVIYTTGRYDVQPSGGGEFSDTKGQWMSQAVAYMSARHVVLGVGQNRFAPAGIITREQYVTMLMRALQADVTASEQDSFADAASIASWAKKAVSNAASLGFVEPDERGHFNPKQPITREDMFLITYRAMDKFGILPDVTTMQFVEFKDWDQVSEQFKKPIQKLAILQLAAGHEGQLRPQGTSTRAEAAQFLYNILKFEQN